MRVYFGTECLGNIVELFCDAQLRNLIKRRLKEVFEYGDFYETSSLQLVVIEIGDISDVLDGIIGFGVRDRNCDAIERHESWFELTFVTSDDGEGVVVFVPRSQLIDEEILNYCNQQMELISP